MHVPPCEAVAGYPAVIRQVPNATPSTISDDHDVITQKLLLILRSFQKSVKSTRALITPNGLKSSPTMGTCRRLRSFMIDHTSFSKSPGRQ